MEIPKSFLGYKRENGRAGTRNHVIILPVDDISNACAEAVANNKKRNDCPSSFLWKTSIWSRFRITF